MTDVMAITVWQPWATLIAEGMKPFEFRSYAAPQRLWNTRIAIHAGARPIKRVEVADLILRLTRTGRRDTGIDPAPALELLDRVR